MNVYLNVLPDYFKKLNQNKKVKHQFINQKAITSSQLFGIVNKNNGI